MAEFYGRVLGSRGEATRTGTKSSGINAILQSWHGSVVAELYYDSNNELMLAIYTGEGSTAYPTKHIVSIPIKELVKHGKSGLLSHIEIFPD